MNDLFRKRTQEEWQGWYRQLEAECERLMADRDDYRTEMHRLSALVDRLQPTAGCTCGACYLLRQEEKHRD